ncbi:MFS transporter [Arthrobacter crystallopoietes]|uniref:MFS transporter n=1 Tax=Crystallibacter crystallopoietes TaxID=37928 RepID=UPI001ABDD1DE|nr:MFS transporter [Arthrobacter crystallopoietes]QTG81773.1 MFS transporter [Arthrobacter crystallopoietes]
MNVLTEIRASRMGRFQIMAVAIALALILIDGFDVAVMAYAAPDLSREWGLDPVTLGFLLSASLFGMAAGSILLTPLADRIGRRKLTIISMAIISVGMVLSVISTGPAQLMTYRVLTGLGVGGMMANLNVLVSEYASDKRRGSIIGIYAAGYPIGATIGGFVAGPLIPAFGWQSAFLVGAVLSVIMFAVSWLFLPESLDYLLVRRPPGALEKANRILARIGRPALSSLPLLPEAEHSQGGAVREILTSPVKLRTLMLWTGYACLVAAYYFANTWTPKIMAAASGDDSLGVTVGVIANFGGILGCFIFSALAIRYRSNRLLMATLAGAAAAYIMFGLIFTQVSVAVVVALFLGILTTAGIAGFYAVAPGVYTARARATGIGWMIGIGRLVSIVAPILVGYLIAGGWQPENIFFLFAIPLAASAVCILALGISLRRNPTPGLLQPVAETS